MHDLHVADKIVKLAKQHAQENKLNNVKQININLGKIIEHSQEINPENLEFNIINLLKDSDIFNNVKININKVGTDSWELESITGE